MGEPKSGWLWLSINNTPGHAVPLGRFVQVPTQVRQWNSVQPVLDQLHPVDPIRDARTNPYKFGFLLGIMIGDASKKRQKNWHRHIELVLSKRYETSVRIGDFTAECARAIGLRTERRPDRAPYNQKPHGFYVWESQSSALVDWLFNTCLGLRDGELTTYNPVRMKWALSAPRDFRTGLLQGIAESDGSVSIASQTVEFWIGPNWDFVRRLLSTFGVRSFRNREALSVTKKEVRRLKDIPAFSPLLRTVRFQRFERLAAATHIEHGRRVPVEIRRAIMEARVRGMSVPEISEEILRDFGLVLTFEAVQRWAVRQQSQPNEGPSAKKQAELQSLRPRQQLQ